LPSLSFFLLQVFEFKEAVLKGLCLLFLEDFREKGFVGDGSLELPVGFKEGLLKGEELKGGGEVFFFKKKKGVTLFEARMAQKGRQGIRKAKENGRRKKGSEKGRKAKGGKGGKGKGREGKGKRKKEKIGKRKRKRKTKKKNKGKNEQTEEERG